MFRNYLKRGTLLFLLTGFGYSNVNAQERGLKLFDDIRFKRPFKMIYGEKWDYSHTFRAMVYPIAQAGFSDFLKKRGIEHHDEWSGALLIGTGLLKEVFDGYVEGFSQKDALVTVGAVLTTYVCQKTNLFDLFADKDKEETKKKDRKEDYLKIKEFMKKSGFE